ncbi:2-aminoethylphosphonate--pyruvate transaminase [bacterium SCSIO 12696]|nr:2-aminoethylphosphonate--pyruvate transaminase [bacterium SCSIO 12696]
MNAPVNTNHYLLLTPGPLTTSDSVRHSMLKDWCTWDDEYNNLVQSVRHDLVALATLSEGYTAVLMQGSGTASVEATIGSAVPENGKLLILSNGAYGDRIVEIANYLRIDYVQQDHHELDAIDLERLQATLAEDSDITHVAVVHCETTTGRLNDIPAVSALVKQHNKVLIVDAMSSFGGLPMDVAALNIDFLVSSANKCIQGVPGFGFVIAKTDEMEKLEGRARSLSLDLYDQWKTMETQNGKWRFTSPTHVVRAFRQALDELNLETLEQRYQRYRNNQSTLAQGMAELGFKTMIDASEQSPFITSFFYPESEQFEFNRFYEALKQQGFVIYPGKVSNASCFRIGTIGEVQGHDIERLLGAIKNSMYWV